MDKESSGVAAGRGAGAGAGRGVRLEYRARSAEVLAPIVNDPRGWLTALTGDVLRLVPEDAAAGGAAGAGAAGTVTLGYGPGGDADHNLDDAALFGGLEERVSDEALAAGPGGGGGMKLHDAVLKEWRAMSVS